MEILLFKLLFGLESPSLQVYGQSSSTLVLNYYKTVNSYINIAFDKKKLLTTSTGRQEGKETLCILLCKTPI